MTPTHFWLAYYFNLGLIFLRKIQIKITDETDKIKGQTIKISIKINAAIIENGFFEKDTPSERIVDILEKK